MRIPRHVAIIMDGNGRWAQARGHSRIYGHTRGGRRVEPVVEAAGKMGVRALTLFAFSTENWIRPDSEKNVLFKLFRKYLIDYADKLDRQNVRFTAIGELERMDSDLRALIDRVTAQLSKNTGLRLNLAFSYGSRSEIARAAGKFSQDCALGLHRPEDLNESLFEKYLWTSVLGELSDVDLVIRTSGEKRVSNFLLWQSAYAEYVFSERLWPDFTAEDFRAAVEEYSARERRFGGVRQPSITI